MEKLIVGPFCQTQISTLIIIDAIDECQDREPTSAFLSILSCYVNKIPLVKFFITGRPEPQIRSGFHLASLQPHTEVLRLHEVKPDLVDSDIKLFLKIQLTDIIKKRSHCNLTEEWPSPGDLELLCKKAAGFFIFASTVVKFVASHYHPPTERLALIISLPQDTSYEGRSGIDLLYTQVLEQAFHNADQEFFSHFKSVVGAVLLISNPLSINALSQLLQHCGSPSRIHSTLRVLHSLLHIPDSMDDPVHIFHKSFPDFLMDPRRCTDNQFMINPPVHHQEIVLSCLTVMKSRLKRNICKLDDYALLSQVEDLPACRRAYIGDALGYACRSWTNHLMGVSNSSIGIDEVLQAINEFFLNHFLFWIEVLSLMENLDVGVHALNNIQQWYTSVSYVEDLLSKPIFTFI